ncbi:MAG: glycosyltransferase family 4 protein, partial [Armatimonadota bacterium]
MTMRIALLTSDYPPDVIGGAGVSCSLLARHLRHRGLHVDVFAFVGRDAKAEREHPTSAGNDYYLRRPPNVLALNVAAAYRLRGRVRDYDVVHACDAVLMPACRTLAPRTRGACVATLNNLRAACFTPELSLKEDCYRHGWLKSLRCVFANPEPSSRFRGLLYTHPAFHLANYLSRGLALYIALSEDVQRHYVGAGFPEERIVVIPNMLDEDLFWPPRGPTPGADADAMRVVLYVGQLDHRKGVLDLVQAYARLPAHVRETTTLRFLGRGKDEAPIRAAAARCGIEGRVEIRHCPYQRLPQEYRRAHVFVA